MFAQMSLRCFLSDVNYGVVMAQWTRHMPLVCETWVWIHCKTPMCPWARHL